MPKNRFSIDLLQLNFALFLISTSGVLGRYINTPVPITICIRAALAVGILFVFCKIRHINLTIQKKDRKTVFLGGVFLCLHWLSYFYALQLSNVAIGMLSLFTFPVITAIIEPFITKTNFSIVHLLMSVLILLGIYFLVPEFNLENDHFIAVGSGIVSAFCYAMRNILLKTKVAKYDSSALMFYQLMITAIVLSPSLFLLNNSMVVAFLPATLLLAFVTTALGHTLFLYSLKKFSTITASIMSGAQPIYGIIGGMIFLNEQLTQNILIGGSIILLTVFIESIRMFWHSEKSL